MADLFLDKAGADSVISKVSEQIEAMREAAEKIDQYIVNELPNYWRGNAHDKAESTYQGDYQSFIKVKVPDMVEQLRQYMSDCVEAIKNVDDQLSGG